MKAVILAGGAGTRLWPISRQKQPKQFQSLLGEETMLQTTIKRLNFLNSSDIYIATNSEYRELVIEQSQNLIPPENIIIEPALRETSACIGLIATILNKNFPDEVMALFNADHLISNQEEFIEKLKIAEQISREEKTLNIIEVEAIYPNVNLGYVKVGSLFKEIDGTSIYHFEKFTEKPDQQTAETFIKEGNYLWNTGLYVWKISTILEKYEKYQPKTFEVLQKISEKLGTPEEKSTIDEWYPQLEKISIDYAIMEKLSKDEVKIISSKLGWSDIGTWDLIYDVLPKDSNNNVIRGKSINHDTSNTLIYGNPDQLIATIGVKDLVIVQTKDALLICNKKQSHDIKKLMEIIKKDHPHLT